MNGLLARGQLELTVKRTLVPTPTTGGAPSDEQ